MFSFGEFDELEAGHGNFSVWELWLFILVGCMGGLIGACFNRFNQRLSAWRRWGSRSVFCSIRGFCGHRGAEQPQSCVFLMSSASRSEHTTTTGVPVRSLNLKADGEAFSPRNCRVLQADGMHSVREADGGAFCHLPHDGRLLRDAHAVGHLHAQAGGHGRLDRAGNGAVGAITGAVVVGR